MYSSSILPLSLGFKGFKRKLELNSHSQAHLYDQKKKKSIWINFLKQNPEKLTATRSAY
jgi:hypothetical protein